MVVRRVTRWKGCPRLLAFVESVARATLRFCVLRRGAEQRELVHLTAAENDPVPG